MRPTQDQMDRLVADGLGRLDDLFQGWMTAADDEHDAVGGVDHQRHLAHRQVDAPGASQHEQMKSRCHFGGLANPGEIGCWPWAAETQRLRWSAVEVAHVLGKRLVASVKRAWQSGTEHAKIFLRRVNRDAGVDLQEMI